MDTEIKSEIENLGGDFTQPEWQWLLNNGPHGKSFTWSQTKNEPPGFVGVELLEKVIAEKSENNPTFIEQATTMVSQALQSTNTNILIRATQIAAVIGTKTELKTISSLTKHPDELVFKNAKASVFYLKKRLKSQVT